MAASKLSLLCSNASKISWFRRGPSSPLVCGRRDGGWRVEYGLAGVGVVAVEINSFQYSLSISPDFLSQIFPRGPEFLPEFFPRGPDFLPEFFLRGPQFLPEFFPRGPQFLPVLPSGCLINLSVFPPYSPEFRHQPEESSCSYH